LNNLPHTFNKEWSSSLGSDIGLMSLHTKEVHVVNMMMKGLNEFYGMA